MKRIDNIMNEMTFYSLCVLSLFLFTAFGLCWAHHILIAIPGAYFLYRAVTEKSLPKLNLSMIGLCAFICIIFISNLFNIDKFSSIFKIFGNFKYFLIGFLSIFALKELFSSSNFTEKRKKFLIYSFILSVSIATISGLIAFKTGFNPLKFKAIDTGRASGMYGMVMSYAYSLGNLIPLFLSLLVFKQKKLEINSKAIIIFIVINTIGLYFSYTRGGILGFLAGFSTLSFIKSKKLFLYFSAPVTIVVILSMFNFIDMGSRDQNSNRLFQKANSSSNKIRISQFKASLYTLKDNPFFGVGFKNFQKECSKIKKKYNIEYPHFSGESHNMILEVASGTGLIGLLAFLVWMLGWLKQYFIDNNPHIKIFIPTLGAFLFSGLFESQIGDGEIMYLIMVLYAISQSIMISSSNPK